MPASSSNNLKEERCNEANNKTFLGCRCVTADPWCCLPVAAAKMRRKPTAEPVAAEAEVEATEAPAPVGDVANGKATYDTLCIACHGADGIGVEGLGKPFTASEFLAQVPDEEFVEFIKTGRDISDPENTTGIAMPPKSGNPALNEEQMIDIVAYVRTLHE